MGWQRLQILAPLPILTLWIRASIGAFTNSGGEVVGKAIGTSVDKATVIRKMCITTKILIKYIAEKIQSIILLHLQNIFYISHRKRKLKNLITHTDLSSSHPLLRGAANYLGCDNFFYLIRRPRI